ncbi:Mechanosensitive ion channel-domain-containing protein [Entophlyctis helioformis]|nr:Mechanosensitive ion channel-domain-containing protein [Entophlyctis helioformis]
MCLWFQVLPPWLRLTMLLFAGSSVLFCPAAVFVALDRRYLPDLVTFEYGDLLAGGQLSVYHQLVRWSFWLTVSWDIAVVAWFTVGAVPMTIEKFCKWFYREFPESVRTRLEFITAIRVWIAQALFFIFSVIAFAIIFPQMGIVDMWYGVFRVLCMLLVLSICLFIQRLTVQYIAINFHRVAYEDRIKESKRAVRALDRLSKSIKTNPSTGDSLEMGRDRKATPSWLRASNPNLVNLANSSGTVTNNTTASLVSSGTTNASVGSSPTDTDAGKSLSPSSARLPPLSESPTRLTSPGLDFPLVASPPVQSQARSDDVVVSVTHPYDDTRSDPSATGNAVSGVGLSSSPATATTATTATTAGSTLSPDSATGMAQRHASPDSPATRPAAPPTLRGMSVTSLFHRKSRATPTAGTAASSAGSADQARASASSPHSPGGDTASITAAAKRRAALSEPTQPPSRVMIGGSKYAKKIKRLDVSEKQAVKLGRKLFAALGGTPQQELSISSFSPYFQDEQTAKDAFEFFDKDGNGTLSEKEMKQAVVRIYRERHNLFSSLRDLSQALGCLNQVLYGVSIVITCFLSLPIYGIPLTAVLPFTTILVALSFVFGGSAKTGFECIVFLFVTHPYDTGDRIIVDGQGYKVLEINLLTTVLERNDGQKVYAPNAALIQKFIHNIRRSGDQSESIEVHMDFHTPEETIHELQARMLAFVKSQSRDYNPACDLSIAEFDNLNRLKCNIGIKYKGNWQDGGKRWARRNAFMYALKRHLDELGVRYEAVTLPVRVLNGGELLGGAGGAGGAGGQPTFRVTPA